MAFVLISIIAASILEYRSLPEKAAKYPDAFAGGIGDDFHIYYEAVRGNYGWFAKFTGSEFHDGIKCGWLYPNYTRWFWFWTLPFAFDTAFLINTILYVIFFCSTFLRIYKYAKSEIEKILVVALFAAAIQWFRMDIAGGNIVPLLALLILTPWGCVLAGCFKLWLLGFLGVHFILAAAKRSNCTPIDLYDSYERLDIPFVDRWYTSIQWMEKVICYFRNYDNLF